MSEKWEVVGGGKKKKIGNGIPKPQPVVPSSPVKTTTTTVSRSSGKTKKGRPKVSMDYKVKQTDEFKVPVPGEEPDVVKPKKVKPLPTQAKAQQPSNAPKVKNDLEATLGKVECDELTGFFEKLQFAESDGEVHLSWIRYTADVLNSRLSKVPTPDISQYPNDLNYPRLPPKLAKTVQSIVAKTVMAGGDSADVIGVSFSSLLASLPMLIQRGDPAWGYLLFLREMVRMDPELAVRRSKSHAELMESYGNRKEVGTACLWVSAQACLHSPSVLRIVLGQILPFYNFKHFKPFVVSILRTLAHADMAGDIVVDPEEFEEFFDAAFDPKKRQDFERFYPRIKALTLKNLNGHGRELFANFLARASDKEFSSFSAVGHEVLDILHGCLENDPSVMSYWPEIVSQFPRESADLLNYLSRNVANLNSAKSLESQFIQSDEFAVAAVKHPELLRAAKKVQGEVRVKELASRRRFSWKMGSFVLLLTIVGLLWLDVAENGKGSFSKSNVGKLLESCGLLDEALYVGEQAGKLAKVGYEFLGPIFRNIYEGLRPVLQAIDKQLQIYIPELVGFIGVLSEKTVSYFNFLTEKVFVGSLSPENIRKVTKEVLTIVWTNLYLLATKVFELVGLLVKTVQGYL